MNKKTKNIITAICIVLVSVLLCGFTMRLTDNFTKFKPSEVFARKLNSDNLFVGQIEDAENTVLSNGVSYQIDNGVYEFSGKTAADGNGDNSFSAEPKISVATLKLKPGTYTFTCFKSPVTSNGYYAYGTYTVGSDKHVWFADFQGDSVNSSEFSSAAGYVQHARTITLTEETEIHFGICITKGADMSHVKAFPMIVSGKNVGEFYAPFFG